jgi:hypothetical protein
MRQHACIVPTVALAKAKQYLKLFEKYIVAPYAYNEQFKYYNPIVNVNII